MALLKIENIRHRFDDIEVVRGASFDLQAGEFLCLLGPSGCGKTTLLRLAAGLEPVQQGALYLGGELVGNGKGVHVPPEQRRVGLMFQDFALFPHLSVRQNIDFGIQQRTAESHAWVQQMAQRMGITQAMDAYPHTLSGGQQQRVALLRALAPSPRVLLLDEPFSGLDVTRRAQVREETLALVKDTGTAALMVTHDPEEAMFMADRIAVMQEGQIVQIGSPAEIYFSPANAYVASLFGSLNRIQGEVHDGLVTTILGQFAASGMADGSQVEILIRPEDIQVQLGVAEGCEAIVQDARLLGHTSHLRLAAQGTAADHMDLQARVAKALLPEQGSSVTLSVDPARVLVFPLR